MQSEFEFIHNIKTKYGLNRIGDDCAVLPNDQNSDMLVTADLLVENIDFRLDWMTPGNLGLKAAAVSISDIAAMGGRPRWAMITIGAPEERWRSNDIDDLFHGYHEMAKNFEVEIIGGDISRSGAGLVIDSIVGGEVPAGRAVLRSGAKPGDSIFVTGALGGSAAGLELLEREGSNAADRIWKRRLVVKHLNPWPRVNEGESLRDLGVTSMIDLSDGLSSDLGHICDSSGVGALIRLDDVPVHKNIKSMNLTREKILDLALSGGEDFELLFTADEKNISIDELAGFHRIGTVTERSGIIELSVDGERRELKRSGYRHF